MIKNSLFLIVCLLLFSCANTETPHLQVGTFIGELPCEDCDFIKTKLELNEDNSFLLEQEKVGAYAGSMETITGEYSLKRKAPQGPTEFKLGVLELKGENNQTHYYKILSPDELEVLNQNLEPLDKKLKYSLKRLKDKIGEDQ